ncbi:MAG: protein-disulfide reductase DsbD domain-containing protein [Flavisolibacter sp.]
MKKGMFLLLCIVAAPVLWAQDSPVSWSFSAKKLNASTYEVHLTANIEEGWHVYSQGTPDGGPVPTSFSFMKNPLVKTGGAAKEVGKLEQHFEPLFGVEVKQYSNKVDFVQLVTVRPGVKTSFAGTVEYMSCNDTECMPPARQRFSVALR